MVRSDICIPHTTTITTLPQQQASIEAQEAACELLYHWLATLRRLDANADSNTSTTAAPQQQQQQQQHRKRKGKGKGKTLAQRFAEVLPDQLRPLASFRPPSPEGEGEEGGMATQGTALGEVVGCVLVLGVV